MREIKFRGWSKETGCFCSAFSIHYTGRISDMIDAKIDKDSGLAISDAHWDQNDLIVMQYTGLKDKNGVEIYEGDIVRMKSYNHSFQNNDNCEVYYNSKEARFKFRNKKIFPGRIDSDNTTRHSIEVLGNIYENKELLNE